MHTDQHSIIYLYQANPHKTAELCGLAAHNEPVAYLASII